MFSCIMARFAEQTWVDAITKKLIAEDQLVPFEIQSIAFLGAHPKISGKIVSDPEQEFLNPNSIVGLSEGV